MHNGVKVLMSDRGEDFELNALELELAGADIVGPAVDGNVVTTGNQPGRKMFSEGFEPAIVGGNSAGAKNRKAHNQKGTKKELNALNQ